MAHGHAAADHAEVPPEETVERMEAILSPAVTPSRAARPSRSFSTRGSAVTSERTASSARTTNDSLGACATRRRSQELDW